MRDTVKASLSDLTTRVVNLETEITCTKSKAADHSARITILEEATSEAKRIRLLSCNVRVVPLTDCHEDYNLKSGMSDETTNNKLSNLIKFIEEKTGHRPIQSRSRTVFANGS